MILNLLIVLGVLYLVSIAMAIYRLNKEATEHFKHMGRLRITYENRLKSIGEKYGGNQK